MLNLEAVVVCVNYSDFLEYTLPHNMQFFDRIVIVSDHNDKLTKRVCDKYSVDCIRTEVMYDDGDKFNKGRAINLGLQNLRHDPDSFLCHIDADVLLPHNFSNVLKMAKIKQDCIYGCDRLNTISYENFDANIRKGTPQHQWRFMVTPNPEFPVGSRLLHKEYGWLPIGFFQLWGSSMGRQYPIVCGSAEHSDVLFSVQWPREKRLLLPEFFCYHLESEAGEMGVNWKGRKTKIFGFAPNKHQDKDVKY